MDPCVDADLVQSHSTQRAITGKTMVEERVDNGKAVLETVLETVLEAVLGQCWGNAGATYNLIDLHLYHSSLPPSLSPSLPPSLPLP